MKFTSLLTLATLAASTSAIRLNSARKIPTAAGLLQESTRAMISDAPDFLNKTNEEVAGMLGSKYDTDKDEHLNKEEWDNMMGDLFDGANQFADMKLKEVTDTVANVAKMVKTKLAEGEEMYKGKFDEMAGTDGKVDEKELAAAVQYAKDDLSKLVEGPPAPPSGPE